MVKKIIAGATLALLTTLLTPPAIAFDRSIQMTGAEFSKACTRAEESWISFCNGYAQAAVDSIREGDGICIPRGTTRTNIVTLTEKVITATNQLQAMNALEALRFIMRHAYPC